MGFEVFNSCMSLLSDWLIDHQPEFDWRHLVRSYLKAFIKQLRSFFLSSKYINIKGIYPSILADQKKYEKRFGKVILCILEKIQGDQNHHLNPRRKISFFREAFPEIKRKINFLKFFRKFHTTGWGRLQQCRSDTKIVNRDVNCDTIHVDTPQGISFFD